MFYLKEKTNVCPICKKDFKTIDVRVRYCSFTCANEAKKQKIKIRRMKYEKTNALKFRTMDGTSTRMAFKCKNCGKEFERYRSQVRHRGAGYCSVECRFEAKNKIKPTDDRLVDMWSFVVKLYDDNKCAYCGKTSYLNSHHIFSRSNHSTRYHIPNGITLCAGCHTLSSKFSAHKTPVEFIEWIKEKRGEEWYQKLRLMAHSTKKYTSQELVNIRDNFMEIMDHFNAKFNR